MRVACLLLIATASSAATQDSDTELPPAVAAPARLLTESVAAELKILCRIGKLDKATRERLQKEMTGTVRQFATDLSSKRGKFERYRVLPISLRMKVADAVCGATSDTNAAGAVRDDVAKRNAFHAQLRVDGFVAMVDHAAWLSSKQLSETQKLGQQLQKQGKLPNCLQLLRSGLTEESTQAELKKLLSAEQFARWKKARNGRGMEASIVGDSNMSREARRTQLRDGYAALGQQHIRWYTAELDLQPPQVKRLQLSLKGLISRAVPEELDRHDQQDAAQPDPAAMGFESVLTKPFASDRWMTFLKAALTNDQMKRLDQLMNGRSTRLGRLLSGYVITAISSGHKSGNEKEMWLDAKQQKATHDLMVKQFSDVRTLSGALPGHFVRLANVSDAAYQKAMGEENWNQFKPMIEQLRELAKASRE